MEKVVRKFKSHDEADKADHAFYQSLSSAERIEILIRMIDDYYGTEHRLERVPESARILSKADFVKSKLAVGGPEDLADAAAVELESIS